MYKYPYGNSEELNLDWFLNQFQSFTADVQKKLANATVQSIIEYIAGEYDTAKNYSENDYCVYEGSLYRATTSTTGVFNADDWILVKLADDLTYRLNMLTSDIIANNSTLVSGYSVSQALDNLKSAINAIVIVGDNTAFTNANIPCSAILKGTFILSSEYIMSEKQILVGEGATITVSDSGKITMNKYCSIENLNFVGNYNPARTTSGAHLVPIMTESNLANQTYITGSTNQGTSNSLITCTSTNCVGLKVTGCSFSNLDKMVIFINGGNHTTDTGFIISDNYFNTVWNAVCVYGEFGHVNGNTFIRCILGITLAYGVTEKCNNTFKQCDVSLYYIATSGNMAHGTMSGCNICHSGLFSIYIKTISATTGEIIVGCQIAEGGVKAEVANNLLFIGCRLDTWFNIVSGSKNKIANNIIRVAYLDGHNLYTVPSDTIIRDNVPIDTATMYQVNPIVTKFLNFTIGTGLTGISQGIYDEFTDSVRIRGYIYMATNIPTSTVLFTAPEGYRPTSNFAIFMELTLESGVTVPYYGIINPNGEITQALGNTVQKIFVDGEYPLHY